MIRISEMLTNKQIVDVLDGLSYTYDEGGKISLALDTGVFYVYDDSSIIDYDDREAEKFGVKIFSFRTGKYVIIKEPTPTDLVNKLQTFMKKERRFIRNKILI